MILYIPTMFQKIFKMVLKMVFKMVLIWLKNELKKKDRKVNLNLQRDDKQK